MRTSQKIYLPFKRLIGILGSIIGIIFCLVLFWWWIFPINLIVTKGHPVFKSYRIGRNGKGFNCLKFRTMALDANPNVASTDVDDANKRTVFGTFLRKTSLDETLQIFNILIGQMAFIGPRPLIDVSADSVTNQKRKENGSISLRPGLSGWAQIHKREKLEAELKAEFDGYYFQNFSLFFDIKIFILTLFYPFIASHTSKDEERTKEAKK